MQKAQEEDYKRYFIPGGDKGFSPKKNEHIINHTIEMYEKKKAQERKNYAEMVAERADAVVHYLKHLASNAHKPSVEKYFGRKHLAHLQGRKIMMKLQRLAGHNQSPIYQLEELS